MMQEAGHHDEIESRFDPLTFNVLFGFVVMPLACGFAIASPIHDIELEGTIPSCSSAKATKRIS